MRPPLIFLISALVTHGFKQTVSVCGSIHKRPQLFGKVTLFLCLFSLCRLFLIGDKVVHGYYGDTVVLRSCLGSFILNFLLLRLFFGLRLLVTGNDRMIFDADTFITLNVSQKNEISSSSRERILYLFLSA